MVHNSDIQWNFYFVHVWAESSTAPFWPNLCLDPLVCVDTLELLYFFVCAFSFVFSVVLWHCSVFWSLSHDSHPHRITSATFFMCLIVSCPILVYLSHHLFPFCTCSFHFLKQASICCTYFVSSCSNVFFQLRTQAAGSVRLIAVHDLLTIKGLWDLLWGLSFLIHIKEMETSFASEPASQLIK